MSAPERGSPPAARDLRPFRFPPVQRALLDNGIRILAARSGDLPLVTVQLVVDAGGMHDGVDQVGTASLTAALLESGAAGRSAEEIALTVDELGIALEVSTSWDSTSIGFTALSSRLEPAFALLASLVRAPDFPAAEVDRLREERLGSVQHRRADPGSVAAEVLSRFVFPGNSPYSRALGGTRAALTAVTRDSVVGFHRRRYSPAATALIAAGDISVDRLSALAERYLGDWAAVPTDAPFPGAVTEVRRPMLVVANRPGAVQSEVRVGHLGVERTAPDYAALQVMNAVLGGTFSSRLNLNLRERLGYTYGASSSWSPRRVPGIFSMGAAVQQETTAHSVAEMLREMRGMQEAPPTPDEVGDARSYLAGVLPLTLETTAGVAARLAALEVYGLPDGYWETYRDSLLRVSPTDAHEAARTRLRPDACVIVVCADAEVVVPGLEALGEGQVQVVDADSLLG